MVRRPRDPFSPASPDEVNGPQSPNNIDGINIGMKDREEDESDYYSPEEAESEGRAGLNSNGEFGGSSRVQGGLSEQERARFGGRIKGSIGARLDGDIGPGHGRLNHDFNAAMKDKGSHRGGRGSLGVDGRGSGRGRLKIGAGLGGGVKSGLHSNSVHDIDFGNRNGGDSDYDSQEEVASIGRDRPENIDDYEPEEEYVTDDRSLGPPVEPDDNNSGEEEWLSDKKVRPPRDPFPPSSPDEVNEPQRANSLDVNIDTNHIPHNSPENAEGIGRNRPGLGGRFGGRIKGSLGLNGDGRGRERLGVGGSLGGRISGSSRLKGGSRGSGRLGIGGGYDGSTRADVNGEIGSDGRLLLFDFP